MLPSAVGARRGSRGRRCGRPGGGSARVVRRRGGANRAADPAHVHRPRQNSWSSSRRLICRQVGRPWLHWSARSVRSMSRSSAFISSMRQLPVGAHRAVAGHRRQQAVAGALEGAARAELGEFGEDAARQLDDVAVGQRRRHRAHAPACRPPSGARSRPRARRASPLRFGGGDLDRGGGEGGGDQQRLRPPAPGRRGRP